MKRVLCTTAGMMNLSLWVLCFILDTWINLCQIFQDASSMRVLISITLASFPCAQKNFNLFSMQLTLQIMQKINLLQRRKP